MRERNYEGHPSQSERERRFGPDPGERGSRGRERDERYGASDWRDEGEGFEDDDFERPGFEGQSGQGGWRQDYGQFGSYGQGPRRGEFGTRGQFGQGSGYGQGGRGFGRGREEYERMRGRFGQGYERQEYGIDRPEDYRSQPYGRGFGQGQGYGQGYGSERATFGQQGGQREYARGRFTGRGPKGWRRSDESVLERVNETLEQHPEIDASEIEVTCSQGEIVLRGTVDERRAKRLAEDAIEGLPGVKDVRNEIRVQTGQPSQQDQGGQPLGGQHNGGGRSRTERA